METKNHYRVSENLYHKSNHGDTHVFGCFLTRQVCVDCCSQFTVSSFIKYGENQQRRRLIRGRKRPTEIQTTEGIQGKTTTHVPVKHIHLGWSSTSWRPSCSSYQGRPLRSTTLYQHGGLCGVSGSGRAADLHCPRHSDNTLLQIHPPHQEDRSVPHPGRSASSGPDSSSQVQTTESVLSDIWSRSSITAPPHPPHPVLIEIKSNQDFG